MAANYAARRLQLQRSYDRRFNDEQAALSRALGGIVDSWATERNADGEKVVPNNGLQLARIQQVAWQQVLMPYYIGAGREALGPNGEPQSPYAATIVEGIEAVTRNAADQSVALLRRYASPKVIEWMTGIRPIMIHEQRGIYDPYFRYVDPNGYRLSDRIWQASIQTRANINHLLQVEIGAGTSAVRMAGMLDHYLVPSARAAVTSKPYGRVGNYAARRLSRTEIAAAAGRGVVDSAMANPYVAGIRWRLSGSHPKQDVCDELAHGGKEGNGVYSKDNVPTYPPHPHCLCSLLPVAISNPAETSARIEAGIDAGTMEARQLQGILNPEWLTRAIMGGFLGEALGLDQLA